MDPETYWKQRTERKEKYKETSFAKKCYTFLKNKNSKTILDLGCGDGRDSIFFAKKGMTVTSLDVSPTALDMLRKKQQKENLTITIVEKDILNLPFPENSFDSIYAHLSIHYFGDRATKEICNILHKILKPGGYLFVKCKSTKDYHYGKGEEIEKNMFKEEGKQRHFFDKEYMEEVLQQFKILSVEQTWGRYSTYEKNASHFIEAIVQKK